MDVSLTLCRYAGWLGTVAARYTVDGALSDVVPTVDESRHRLAAVAGTSTCHIVQVSAWLLQHVKRDIEMWYRALKASSSMAFGVLTSTSCFQDGG